LLLQFHAVVDFAYGVATSYVAMQQQRAVASRGSFKQQDSLKSSKSNLKQWY